MASHGFMVFLLGLTIFATKATSQPKPGCAGSCGSLKVPYPFGTRPECYLDPAFLITCNHSSGSPQPYLRKSNVAVLNISLDGELSVSIPVARECYAKSGVSLGSISSALNLSSFHVSNTRNKFTVIGCDTVALIEESQGWNDSSITGCVSVCDLYSLGRVDNGSCSGTGCCHLSIPEGVRSYTIDVSSMYNHSSVLSFNPCGYAFVADERAYNFSKLDLKDLQKRSTTPVVVDWAVGNVTCQEAQKNLTGYACKAANSECDASNNGLGYRCKCSSGYEGNPYLSKGCNDTNECQTVKPCNGICHNLPGGFSCPCLEGYEGDGRKNGSGCRPIGSDKSKAFLIPLCISIVLSLILVAGFLIYWEISRRKLKRLREELFEQNGGFILQQKLANHTGSVEAARIFSAEELKKATDNYDASRVLGQGGFGTVYKGLLPDDKVVAIKKSKVGDQSQIELFINEMVVLSQINHRNVVKLLGCCLETEVPLLVYEFITNGTVSDHIHGKGHAWLPWEMRMKIAAETAEALAYLHSEASMPIMHRDVKPTNILLDDNFTAKVADFGASRLVPLDQTQVTTMVQGTFGYLDPEYFHTSQFTEKSDVYSFGVVLAELLTGEKAVSMDRPQNDRNLAMYFVSSMKEDRLLQILEESLVNEGNMKQVMDAAKIVASCLRVKGEERPTMKEVATELERLRAIGKHPWYEIDLNIEETENLLGMDPERSCNVVNNGESSSSTTLGYESMREHHLRWPITNGR